MNNDRVLVSRRRDYVSGKREYGISLLEGATDEDCRGLEDLENVTSLSVQSENVSDATFDRLCDHESIELLAIRSTARLSGKIAPSLEKLRSLRSYDSAAWYRDGVAAALATLPLLETCGIHDGGLTDAELEDLAASCSLKGLSVDGNTIAGIGLRAFAESDKVSSLSVGRNPLTQDGLECVADISGIEWLLIGGQCLEGLSLACLPRLQRLNRLHLEWSAIGKSHLRELRYCECLRSLWLSYDQCEALGAREIVQLRMLKNLLVCGEASQELLDGLRSAFREAGVECIVEP